MNNKNHEDLDLAWSHVSQLIGALESVERDSKRDDIVKLINMAACIRSKIYSIGEEEFGTDWD